MTVNFDAQSLICIGSFVYIIMGLIAHLRTVKYMNIWNECAESLAAQPRSTDRYYSHSPELYREAIHKDGSYLFRFSFNILFFGLCFSLINSIALIRSIIYCLIFIFSGFIFGKMKTEYAKKLFSCCINFDGWGRNFARRIVDDGSTYRKVVKEIEKVYTDKIGQEKR